MNQSKFPNFHSQKANNQKTHQFYETKKAKLLIPIENKRFLM